MNSNAPHNGFWTGVKKEYTEDGDVRFTNSFSFPTWADVMNYVAWIRSCGYDSVIKCHGTYWTTEEHHMVCGTSYAIEQSNDRAARNDSWREESEALWH